MKNIEMLENEIFKSHKDAKESLAKIVQEKEVAAGEILKLFAKEKETVDKRVAEINAALKEIQIKYDEVYSDYKKALVQEHEQDIIHAEETISSLIHNILVCFILSRKSFYERRIGTVRSLKNLRGWRCPDFL